MTLRRVLTEFSTSLRLKGSDIHVTSYPKSGRNYLSFLLANYIVHAHELGVLVNFENFKQFVATDQPRIPVNTMLPRVFTSHMRWHPNRATNVLLVRHPVDVMESYYYFLRARHGLRQDSFGKFLRGVYGLQAWRRHYRSWQDRVVLTIKYEDLVAGSSEALGRLISLFGMTVNESSIAYAFEQSAFDRMRQIEPHWADGSDDDNARFVREGKSDGKSDLFGQHDLSYLESILSGELSQLGYQI